MKNRPVILYIIPLSVVGGTQSHLSHLIKGFSEQYEIHLATGQKGPLTDFAENLNIPIHILPHLVRNIDIAYDYKAIKESIALIRNLKPCFIHTHNSKAGLVGRIAGRVCGIPTIYTAHGWQFTAGTPIIHRVLSYLNEKIGSFLSQKIICVSDSDRTLALRTFLSNKKKLVTIHLGIEDATDLAISRPDQQPPKVAMVARFDKQKDHNTLLQAISKVNHLSYSIDLIGDGPLLNECQSLATDLGISNRVNFLGNRSDVSEILSHSQLFVLSTNYEGLPISILEAMRAGLPIIATDVDGIPEEVKEGENGLLVPRHDVEALTFALELLVSSPNMRQEMGRVSRDVFMHEFSIARMLNETQSLYQEVLHSSK